MAQEQMTRPRGDGAIAGTPVEGRPFADKTGEGWLSFAGAVFVVVAVVNVMWGIAAIAHDRHFAADQVLIFNLSAWGWISILVAAVQATTGVLILRRRQLGTLMGIFMAGLGAILLLLAIGVYPLWSITMIVMYGLILYGLMVYGLRD